MHVRMPARRECRFAVSLSDQQILRTAAAALIDLGAQALDVDEAAGCIVATTGTSWRSWGERVTVRIWSRTGRVGNVVVRSEPRVVMTLGDWGKADHNISELVAAFDGKLGQDAADLGEGPRTVPYPATNRWDHPPWLTPAEQVRPDKLPTGWYWLAGVIALGCVFAAAVLLSTGDRGFVDRVDAFGRVGIPGELVMNVSEPKALTVFYEAAGAGQENAAVPALTIWIAEPSGEVVELAPPQVEMSYDLPGHSGQAVGTFSADTPGDYLVRVEGEAPADAVLAVGESPFGPLFGAALLVLVAITVALTPAVVAAVRRRTAGRRRAAAVADPHERIPPPPVLTA
jgi:hypothetical protein